MATYNPKNFAMIAGDEMSASNNIPVAFGYYAESTPPTGPTGILNTTATSGAGYFGLRRGTIYVQANPLTPAEKAPDSASLLLSRGTIVLIHGKSNGAVPPLPYVLYVVITSDVGDDTTYEQIYYGI